MTKKKSPESIDFIIVNYKTPDLTIQAVESIYQYASEFVSSVVVVDNGSLDDSIEKISQSCPKVKLLKLKTNQGFASANNHAIKQSSAEFFMLLNSDAKLIEQTDIGSALSHLNSHPQYGVLTPKILLPDGSIDLACHRGEPTPFASITYFLGLERWLSLSKIFGQYHQLYKNLDQTHFIDACSGAAMLVKRSAFEKVGYLDERFFMYAEDLDWCRRFRQAGFWIVYFPHSVALHLKYQSGLAKPNLKLENFLQIPGQNRPSSPSASDSFFDSMRQYYQKHYPASKLSGLVDYSVKLLKLKKKYFKKS